MTIPNIDYNKHETEATKITKTNTEILFEPVGQMIPELSWANIRVKIDVTTLYNETIDLCGASMKLNKEIQNILNVKTI